MKKNEKKKSLKHKRRSLPEEVRLNKRVQNKKKAMNSRIIVDTNIWYYLGKDEELFNKVKNRRVTPNYINLLELTDTINVITTRKESVSNALKRILHFEKNIFYDPPYIQIGKLTNYYNFNSKKIYSHIIESAKLLADGRTIPEHLEGSFRERYETERERRIEATNYWNEQAEEIKEKIKDKKAHREEDAFMDRARYINKCVELSTNNECNIKSLNLYKIELLINTLDVFFKAIETGQEAKFKVNDWPDIEILGYVRPGDKFWTREKKWIRYIKEAGCEEYLFNEDEL